MDETPLREIDLLKKEKELEEKEKNLEKKERELSVLEAAVTGAKYNIYDKIDVSLKTMDRFIYVVVAVLIIAIVASVVLKLG